MKTTPFERGILIRKMIRKATTVQMKAILKAQKWGDQEEPIEDYDYDVAICRSPRCKFRHHFTSPDACIVEWKDLLLDNTHEGKNYKNKLWDTRILPPVETFTVHVGLMRAMGGSLGEDNYLSAYNSDKGVIEAMMDREEMTVTDEEMLQEEGIKKERKRKRKQRKEQKRKEKNAELRRCTEAMAVAYRQAEYEYY
jgi:hypothetical protein